MLQIMLAVAGAASAWAAFAGLFDLCARDHVPESSPAGFVQTMQDTGVRCVWVSAGVWDADDRGLISTGCDVSRHQMGMVGCFGSGTNQESLAALCCRWLRLQLDPCRLPLDVYGSADHCSCILAVLEALLVRGIA